MDREEMLEAQAEGRAERLKNNWKELEKELAEMENRNISKCKECSFYSKEACEVVFAENCPLGIEHIEEVTKNTDVNPDRVDFEKMKAMYMDEITGDSSAKNPTEQQA
ncbi:hypothetical protein AKJ65_00575 [candidate division MSBL1 archaeon SCGC-AAA259E19]|uniref:Uncharacterized protein n=1 Tax=candidate division MSBL1 archaeon SCGC-AAA259E19 TaxID=1698264 RepID=A0A133UNQ4_9EURY|nr:hypothetical protein AKJ65_00575 [candidate division MSBL1 archaeon SCGC-AAA259E19]